MRVKELTGQVFGRLSVIRRNGSSKFNCAVWLCECECGKQVSVPSASLRGGYTKSCGCLHKEKITKHGHTKNAGRTPEYAAWLDMHTRCYRPTFPQFKDYGGRGIQVCVRWHKCNPIGSSNFLADMGTRPSPAHSIDRINNDWSYMPSNCRWATRLEQRHNRR